MAYRHTEYVEEQLASNRLRILEAARRLVSEGGWAQAQIAQVAAAAGFATGTVYRYFPSKAELFSEVLSIVSQREAAVIAEIIRSGATPGERLHSAVRSFVRRALLNRRLAYALIAEPCEREIDEARLIWRHAIGRQIVLLIREGQQCGAFRANIGADVAAALIVGGFMEALVGPLSPLSADFDSQSAAAESLADEIASICCASVAVKPPSHP